jgi:squalene-hopene/tetraprenyl-beta-curcumene cyclase
MSLFTPEIAVPASRTNSSDTPAGSCGDLRACVRAGAQALLDKLYARRPWGADLDLYGGHAHLCGELEGDSILSSEYLLMKWILAQEDDGPGDSRAGALGLGRIANHLRLTQRGFGPTPVATEAAFGEPDAGRGGWGQYPGAPTDLSATVKAYFALKLAGDPVDAPHMRAARELVVGLGGAERINTFSMFYLACLGQVDWDACPAIPPQIALLPRGPGFHLDKVAAWTRTMILPLALCTALRPVRRLPPELGIDELFVDHSRRARLCKDFDRERPASLTNAFIVLDKILKIADRFGVMPLRRRGLRAAETWIRRRMDPATTEGLGAIFPPMVYVQVAFKALGYGRSHPVMRNAERQLDAFMIDAPEGAGAGRGLDHVRLQPCFSPVWDTGIGLYALTEAGYTVATSARVRAMCDWLLERQVRTNGDWIRNLRPEHRSMKLGEDGAAWAFEYRNDWYPDVDDTAMVAKALWRAGAPGDPYRAAATGAVRWILAMQNDDGGWAAFDRTRDRPWMESIPFADHNAMQDPSCPDITGRVLESLITCGVARDEPAVLAGVRYIVDHQRPDGTWFGRWGVNSVYGTWQAVGGLVCAGLPGSAPPLDRAQAWLRAAQNPDGGFGESANSYLDPAGRPAPSSVSQTGWALATLLALAGVDDSATRRAAAYLVRTQLTADTAGAEPGLGDWPVEPAGAWRERWFTGTGFPKVFYLRYHLYRHYFPLMALARFERQGGRLP